MFDVGIYMVHLDKQRLKIWAKYELKSMFITKGGCPFSVLTSPVNKKTAYGLAIKLTILTGALWASSFGYEGSESGYLHCIGILYSESRPLVYFLYEFSSSYLRYMVCRSIDREPLSIKLYELCATYTQVQFTSLRVSFFYLFFKFYFKNLVFKEWKQSIAKSRTLFSSWCLRYGLISP